MYVATRSLGGNSHSADASKEVVFGELRRHGTLHQDIVVVGIRGTGDIRGQAEPVFRVWIDLGRVGPESSLHLLPVITNEDLGSEAIIHRWASLPPLNVVGGL